MFQVLSYFLILPSRLLVIQYRAELLEACLALTSVKYHDNLLILMLLNQWLALTMLRATGHRMSLTRSLTYYCKLCSQSLRLYIYGATPEVLVVKVTPNCSSTRVWRWHIFHSSCDCSINSVVNHKSKHFLSCDGL